MRATAKKNETEQKKSGIAILIKLASIHGHRKKV
jgi:hypothetical protein